MKPEEAIKELESDKGLYESDIVWAGDGIPEGDLILALNMAIEALEKQIPKKPLPENKYYYIGKCPSCCAVFLDNTTKYCGSCGQALDWSED